MSQRTKALIINRLNVGAADFQTYHGSLKSTKTPFSQKLKPDKVLEGFSRLYISLSCVPAILLFGISLIFPGHYFGLVHIYDSMERQEYVPIAMVYIIGRILSFFALYYSLIGITLVIIWIVEGFKKNNQKGD